MQTSDQSSQQSSVIPTLGDRLRTRRKELRLTLQDVAKSASFSVGFISQIERGITVPSLTSLVAVCRVLQLDVGEFFQLPDERFATVTRHNERARHVLDGSPGISVSYERLSAPLPGNILRSTLIHEPPGFRSEPMSHEGEEIFYIVEGELTLEIDGETSVLEQGDSAHFLSTRVHSTWNHTTEPTVVFHTCTMDVFGDEEKSITDNTSVAIARAKNRKKDQLEPIEN